ncbi:MAG: hypothetical protein HXY24_10265 [Rubrivivax sp.]|nr:hypothetical protein [Rubrivivax sp.]
MHCWYLAFRPESLTYTVCRALSECGHAVSVWVADPEFGSRAEPSIQRRVAGIDRVQVVGRDAARLPPSIDRLIVQTFPRPADVMRELPMLASRARAITLISAGDRSRRWRDAVKLQWLEANRLGRTLGRVDRVLYKDGFHRHDLFALLRRRGVVGFDVHSQFLSQVAERDAMHARDWAPDAVRPCLVNFLGSRDPQARLQVLDEVRHRFVSPAGEALSPRPGKRMYWCEYSDAAPGGLPPDQFVATLTQSDFTLCPRGYSLVTHRPLEALLRGSIPVLRADELGLYGVDLVDGRTCIAVGDGGWGAALDRIGALSEDEIVAMRRHVHAMRASLDYAVLARGMCNRLGVQPLAADGR